MKNLPWKYDASKCKSKMMQGYSGCYCEYCRSHDNQPAPWKMGVHDGPNDCEIFIARSTFRHAFQSCGWDGPKKIIVGTGKMPKNVFEIAKSNAKTMADALNLKEGWKS